MPIYEYQCENCDHHFDKLQKISGAPLRECPECQQETLKKLVSAPSFKLKGSGWYETDFKDKKPKTGAKQENPKTMTNDAKSAGEKSKTIQKDKAAT